MVTPFKKILSKLEIPKNDWVLSRFGGCEPPPDAPSADLESGPVDDDAPVSQAPISVAARLFNRWFDHGSAEDVSAPPQSVARMSPNAPVAESSDLPEKEHDSRAS